MAAGATDSTLNFSNDTEVELRQYATTATLVYARDATWSYRASLGAVVGGTLDTNGRMFDIGPGIVGAIGVARQWRARGAWFVTGTATLAASRATTQEAGGERTGLVATDARVGVMAGRTFGPLSPYVLARAFGGPVFWALDNEDVTGGDAYHVQLGAGASLTARRVTLVLDASLVGEQALALSLAVQL